MTKKLLKIFIFTYSLIFLTGCTTVEKNIALDKKFWHEPKQSVTVVKIKPDEPSLKKIGNQGGLLFLAVNAICTAKLNRYLKQASLDWYHNDLVNKFIVKLKKSDISAQIHSIHIDVKQKKNVNFINQIKSDKILFLELVSFGGIREYHDGGPVREPDAYCVLKGELVDTKSKNILWCYTITGRNIVHGDWDQPPSFPNFAKALTKSANFTQDEMLDNFFSEQFDK